jgi:hypothetical protein
MWRLFRYEVRCWRGGSIPDLDDAASRRTSFGTPVSSNSPTRACRCS